MPDSSNQPWIDAIRESFLSLCDADGRLADITQRLEGGKGTYEDAQRYAIRTGELLARAFKKIDPADLPPDQKVSLELADKIVRAPMVENYRKVCRAAAQAQQNINESAGFEVKPVTPRLNADRIDGIAKKLSEYDTFEEGQWLLDDPMVNFSQSVVDDSIEENAELYGEMGGRPKIVRRATWNCCPWCADLAGTYDYPDVPDDVYSRHEHCHCTVEFDPGRGIVQNVHSKQWREKKDRDIIARRERAAFRVLSESSLDTLSLRDHEVSAGHYAFNINELQNGLPRKMTPNAIADKLNGDGRVLQRRVYNDKGVMAVDYDTTDHGRPDAHPTGAHKHVLDLSKRNPHGDPLPLTDQELEDNADIVQRGVNYHDQR